MNRISMDPSANIDLNSHCSPLAPCDASGTFIHENENDESDFPFILALPQEVEDKGASNIVLNRKRLYPTEPDIAGKSRKQQATTRLLQNRLNLMPRPSRVRVGSLPQNRLATTAHVVFDPWTNDGPHSPVSVVEPVGVRVSCRNSLVVNTVSPPLLDFEDETD